VSQKRIIGHYFPIPSLAIITIQKFKGTVQRKVISNRMSRLIIHFALGHVYTFKFIQYCGVSKMFLVMNLPLVSFLIFFQKFSTGRQYGHPSSESETKEETHF